MEQFWDRAEAGPKQLRPARHSRVPSYSPHSSFPSAGVVRASSIFPILSAILLLLGGVCVAASRVYKSKRNIILGAGILFVAAGEGQKEGAGHPRVLVPPSARARVCLQSPRPAPPQAPRGAGSLQARQATPECEPPSGAHRCQARTRSEHACAQVPGDARGGAREGVRDPETVETSGEGNPTG